MASLLLLLLAAACGGAEPATRLQATVRADGGADLVVHGEDGLLVAVVANRAWRGDDAVHAGLYGQRCPSRVDAELERAGAGTLLLGTLANGQLTGEVPAARLATMPTPLVLQVVTSRIVDGAPQLTLGNALELAGDGAHRTIVPFPASAHLATAAVPFVLYVVLPLAAALALWRLRGNGLQRPARVLLVAAVAAVAVIRTTHGELAPLWPRPDQDALGTLEAAYGAGLRDLVRSTRAHRIGDEPLAIAIDAALRTEQQSLAANLQWLLGGATVTVDRTSLPPGRLCIDLTTAGAPPTGDGGTLLQTAIGALRRTGAR